MQYKKNRRLFYEENCNYFTTTQTQCFQTGIRTAECLSEKHKRQPAELSVI